MTKLKYSFLIIALLVIIGCNSQPSPDQGTNAALAVPKNDIAGLSNFAQVSDTLYRGAQPDEKGFKELEKIGVKTIINLRNSHSDNDKLKGLNLKYCEIPTVAHKSKDNDVAAFLRVVTNPAHQPVFVHCQHGADRTGLMIAIYRIYVQGWTKEDALKETEVFGRHKIWINIPKYIKAFDAEEMKALISKAPEPDVAVIE